MHFPSSNTCKSCGNAFWRGESLPRHKITCHLLLYPACRPSATFVARTSKEIPACLNLSWWSIEFAAPLKYSMKDIWSSWYQLCHLHTRSCFKQNMKSVAHLLAPGRAGGKGGFVGEINVGAGWKQSETEGHRVHLCNVCDKDLKSLQTHNQQKICQHIGYVFVCMGCCKKFHTNISTHRYKKLLQIYLKSILTV